MEEVEKGILMMMIMGLESRVGGGVGGWGIMGNG